MGSSSQRVSTYCPQWALANSQNYSNAAGSSDSHPLYQRIVWLVLRMSSITPDGLENIGPSLVFVRPFRIVYRARLFLSRGLVLYCSVISDFDVSRWSSHLYVWSNHTTYHCATIRNERQPITTNRDESTAARKTQPFFWSRYKMQCELGRRACIV